MSGIRPIAFYRSDSNSKSLGGFLLCHAGEIAEIHDLCSPRIVLFEARERPMKIQESIQINGSLLWLFKSGSQRFQRDSSPMLLRLLGACMVNEEKPHQFPRKREELCPIFPLNFSPTHEAKPNIVYQSSGLEGMAGVFTLKIECGDASEILHHQRKQRFERLGLTGTPLLEKGCYFARA